MKENAERKHKDKDKKENGTLDGDAQRNSIADENLVDLFVDFSVAETSVPWQMHGSTESIASASMLPDGDFYEAPSMFPDGQYFGLASMMSSGSEYNGKGDSPYVDTLPAIKVENFD